MVELSGERSGDIHVSNGIVLSLKPENDRASELVSGTFGILKIKLTINNKINSINLLNV